MVVGPGHGAGYERGEVGKRVVPQKYLSKFHAINQEQMETGPIGQIRRLIGLLFHSIFNYRLAWQTHIAAEHLSQGSLSGNFTSAALARTITLLKKMESPPQDVLKALTYAHESLKYHRSAKTIKNDIRNLEVGHSLAICSNSQPHAMILFITCTGIDGNGKKKYRVVQHNQGQGIENYHYQKTESHGGKKRYQTGLEIADVSEENLCSKEAPFISRLLRCKYFGSTKKLYEEILPLLKGKILPPSKDDRLWGHGQLGGSCTALCLLSLIRSQLPKDAYKEFRDLARVEVLLKSYRQIKRGWGNNTTQKMIALEVIKNMKKSLKTLPNELKLVKAHLKKIEKPSKRSRKIEVEGAAKIRPPLPEHAPPPPSVTAAVRMVHHKKPPSEDYANDLQSAIALLKKGNFTFENLDDAKHFLLAAYSVRFVDPVDLSHIKNFLRVASRFIASCEEKAFTKEQLYVLTVISSAMYTISKNLEKKQNPQIDALLTEKIADRIFSFTYSMHKSYNALCLGSYYSHPEFQGLIDYYQGLFFREQRDTPSGLQNLLKKMS